MPEGPEVRKYADALNSVLKGRVVTSLEARTREAHAWLRENENRVVGNRVGRVISHGKHLIGYIDRGFYFHSHLMMWGSWHTFPPTDSIQSNRKKPINSLLAPERDRRERARILVEGGAAILLSAPIFNVGEGDPYEQIKILATLGPDALTYDRRFDGAEFQRRLVLSQHREETIGAALLNQGVVAGLGNYLRAEVLFGCKLDPWRRVADLTERDLKCLRQTIPKLARRSYEQSATATAKDRERLESDPSLVYQPGRGYGTRHLVFRRTNLPCLRCGENVRQLRQKTYSADPEDEHEERTRIIYFCAKCQGVHMI